MRPVCPFVKADRPSEPTKKDTSAESAMISPKCPLGYDSHTFKLGPLSCMICHALLFDCAKIVPCSHSFCKACVSRFKDCPLCGVDIEKIEANSNLQGLVDRFIEGHARIKRSHNAEDKQDSTNDTDNNKNNDSDDGNNKRVIYEDVSLERGAFLVQQAMRAFRAQNIESAKSRLSLCAEDIRGQLESMGNTSELCSQLGAVLGMLGDCCRATGDAGSAVSYFEESVEFLSKLPSTDQEITHTLSISLNKIGDLKYYDGDLKAARSYYFKSLNVRRDAVKHDANVPSQILDLAVSFAKVADVDRNLGDEDVAVDEFQEGIKLLESLTLKSGETAEETAEETALEQRRLSVLEFLKSQIAEKQT